MNKSKLIFEWLLKLNNKFKFEEYENFSNVLINSGDTIPGTFTKLKSDIEGNIFSCEIEGYDLLKYDEVENWNDINSIAIYNGTTYIIYLDDQHVGEIGVLEFGERIAC